MPTHNPEAPFKSPDAEKATLFTLAHMKDYTLAGEVKGQVSLGSVIHDAHFEVRGLDVRWNFGPNGDGSYDYAFRIRPDGTGLYYDFSRSEDGTARPSQAFQCERLR